MRIGESIYLGLETLNKEKISGTKDIRKIRVGEIIELNLNYGALLSVMASQYVTKNIEEYMDSQEYCDIIENNYLWYKHQFRKILIRENNSPLISLKDSGFNLIFEPSVKKDYKYLVREEIIEKIGRISKILEKENKTLIIRSVWRSFAHQRLLWDRKVEIMQKEFPDKPLKEIEEDVTNFVAKENQSMHATGGAVDALIHDLKTDSVLDFGTNEGVNINLNKKCYPHHPDISDTAKMNRKLLIDLFENEGFICDLKEFWHFDYGNASWAAVKGEKTTLYDIIQ